MEYLFLISILIILLRTVYSNIMLGLSLSWLYLNKNKKYKDAKKEFIVIIPVLREQKILKKTLDYFLGINYDLKKVKIILVSTEKEIKENGGRRKTTMDLIKSLKKDINARYKNNIIVHLHYPSADGKMAHQINYSFDYIFDKYKNRLNNIFVAIYNADSRPNLDTFLCVSDISRDKKKKVFQQSALFFDNIKSIRENKNFFAKKYLISNAVLHSRWTLAHEIPRLLRQSFFINHFNKKVFLSHCVGHGLFIRLDFLKKIKRMPTHTVTEDLFFGYLLSALGESINPIPVLEKAEAPNSFLAALKQKYVWFFGPMDHMSYEKFFKENFPSERRYFYLKLLTLQGIVPAVAWFFMGWLFLFVLAYPIFIGEYKLFFAVLLLFVFYGPLSYVLVLYFNKKIDASFKVSKTDYLFVSLFSFFTVFIHSLPPIFSLYAKIKYFFTNKEPNKPKTER